MSLTSGLFFYYYNGQIPSMDQQLLDWIVLLARWLHITVAVTWIGTSIFFMWLDRSFEFNKDSKNPGHVGDVWMVHGGGFYHVEKLLMGPTKVPERLHWFKWESYWTWMSGMFLIVLVYYTGEGTMLLDSMVSDITFTQAILISLFSIFGSWFFYDFVWERQFTKKRPVIGHMLTLAWFAAASYFLCHTLSGRAAYIHIGGMLGTWMTCNVFMRIIPRQIKMVEAAKKSEPVNQDWGKNAKNRSTHNTYFTLPVIFIMLSNHFPQTYGHDWNWLILLMVSAGGAAIREYFVVRLSNPKRSMLAGLIGVALITGVVIFSRQEETMSAEPVVEVIENVIPTTITPSEITPVVANRPNGKTYDVSGLITFSGVAPKAKKLSLPAGCKKSPDDVFSNEVLIHDGKLENVLVRVIRGHENIPASSVPSQEVILDQKGCIYTPRIVGVRVGQKVTFVNSDPIFHNVRSVTKLNQKFNMAMPRKDQRETKVFTKPELFLQAKCSVHPWMGAYIAIMDHPFFAVSNNRGEFSIKDLPAGNYTLEIWHEVFGTQEKELIINETSTNRIMIDFK